jgi:hypothetical protein
VDNNVVTLETAEKLKVAGFPQETYWHWTWPAKTGWVLTHRESGEYYFAPLNAEFEQDQIVQYTSAPTAQEIADKIGFGVTLNTVKKGGWSAGGLNVVGYWPRTKGGTMVEALAALYLELQGANHAY